MKVGDKVRFTGRGISALDGGPGLVVKVEGEAVRVKVLQVARTVTPPAKPGEIYFFLAAQLEVVTEA